MGKSMGRPRSKRINDGDYRLAQGRGWFEVGKFAIRIHETDEGVVVDVYEDKHEDESPLASCYAFTSDCKGE